jgi:hypothetical protein
MARMKATPAVIAWFHAAALLALRLNAEMNSQMAANPTIQLGNVFSVNNWMKLNRAKMPAVM